MSARFSMSSFAGIWRCEVAVGMDRDASMCFAVARAADLRTAVSSLVAPPAPRVEAARPCCWRV